MNDATAKLTFGLVPSAALVPPTAVADMRMASTELLYEALGDLADLVPGYEIGPSTVMDDLAKFSEADYLRRLQDQYDVFGEALGSLRALARLYTPMGQAREREAS